MGLGAHTLWLAQRLRRRPRRGWWDGPITQPVVVEDEGRGMQIVADDAGSTVMVTTQSRDLLSME